MIVSKKDLAKNNIYCPRCQKLVQLEYVSESDGMHMFGCSDKSNCDWHAGIAATYPDGTEVPILEELWRSIALTLMYEKDS